MTGVEIKKQIKYIKEQKNIPEEMKNQMLKKLESMINK